MEFDIRPVLKLKGVSIMGSGRANLLKEIKETGSLAEAAKRTGMSYRHVWGTIQHMEKLYGKKIVRSERGGSERGSSALTEEGEQLLREFDEKNAMLSEVAGDYFKKPNITTDGILVLEGKVVLVKRKYPPFKGRYALPGGFVEYGEKMEDSVVREFEEETGLVTEMDRLLGVYSEPDRDPRGHTISGVFVLKFIRGEIRDSEETSVKLFPIDELPSLAFDHDRIMSDFISASRK